MQSVDDMIQNLLKQYGEMEANGDWDAPRVLGQAMALIESQKPNPIQERGEDLNGLIRRISELKTRLEALESFLRDKGFDPDIIQQEYKKWSA